MESMHESFLDLTGLQHYTQHVQSYVQKKFSSFKEEVFEDVKLYVDQLLIEIFKAFDPEVLYLTGQVQEVEEDDGTTILYINKENY
jgi:hypothetical protein